MQKAVKRLQHAASVKEEDDKLMSDEEHTTRMEKGMTLQDTSRSQGKLPNFICQSKKSAVKPV
jgi:hypothetical protein